MMSKEIPLSTRTANGKEAARLLEDPLFNGVLNRLLADQIVRLTSAIPGSDEGILAHSSFLGISAIKDGLRSVSNDGKMAEKEAAKNTSGA